MSRAIVTCIDEKMEKNLENDFLFTLRNVAKFGGKVYVIYYGNDKKFAQNIKKKFDVEIIFKKKNTLVSNQRVFDIFNELGNLPSLISEVMCIDGGDVWFQSSIDRMFEISKETYGFVEEDIFENENFNLECIKKIEIEKIRDLFIQRSKNKKIINGGMIVGNKEHLMAIMRESYELIRYIGQDFFALDQVVFNYVIRNDGKGVVLPKTYNYTLISNAGKFYTKNNLFYEENQELIQVVHNNGNENRFLPKGRGSIKKVKKSHKKLPGSFWGVTSFFNPAGYRNKYKNYKKFRESSKNQGLKLIAVEAAFNDKDFELKEGDADILIQLRCNSKLWQKERLINIGIKNLPKDCDKFCWIDSDVIFMDTNWIKNTSQLLEDYGAIQLFSSCIRLPKNFSNGDYSDISFKKSLEKWKGVWKTFSMTYGFSQVGGGVLKSRKNPYFEPGLGWAFRTEIFRKYGIYDRSCFSSSDLYMAHLFINDELNEYATDYTNKAILDDLYTWWNKVKKEIYKNVYYLDSTILHLWHGVDKNRNYEILAEITKKYNFDPKKDILMSKSGCWDWSSNKREMHIEIEDFFYMRNEEGSRVRFLNNKFSKKIGRVKIIFLDSFKKLNDKLVFLKNTFLNKIDYNVGIFGRKLNKNVPLIYDFLKSSYKLFSRIYDNKIQRILREYWVDYKFDLNPIDRRMKIVSFKEVDGMNTENIRFLINEIVKRFAKNGVYLEVGSYRGSSLISSGLFNPSTRCIGIDDFSQFDSEGNNKKYLIKNLAKFPELKNVQFYNGNYKKVLKKIFEEEKDFKIDVYYYDGFHSYEEQIEGLRVILPYLSKKCIILVDDCNWEFVGKANDDFLSENLDFKSLFKIYTLKNASPDWWNGMQVIGRNI